MKSVYISSPEVFLKEEGGKLQLIVTTGEEPVQGELVYLEEDEVVRVKGFESGVELQIRFLSNARTILSAGAELWIGNVGGSEDAFQAKQTYPFLYRPQSQ